MVDIIRRGVRVLHGAQGLDGGQDVVVRQRAAGHAVAVAVIDHAVVLREVQALVELVTAHRGKVVVLDIAEDVVEEALGDLGGRRGGGTEPAVNLFLGLFLVRSLVRNQRVADGRGDVRALGVQNRDFLDALVSEGLDELGGELVGCLGEDGFGRGLVLGLGIDDVLREEHALKRVRTHLDGVHAGFADEAPLTLGDEFAGVGNDLAVLIRDVGVRGFLAVEILVDLPENGLLVTQGDIGLHALGNIEVVRLAQFLRVEVIKDVRLAHAHGLEQDGHGHLAPAVYAHIQDILVVKVEVEPGSAHGDHAAGVEHLVGSVRLAAVMLEDDARGALQLVDDDALGAVDDKRALFGHQGQGAEIDVLLLDVADIAFACPRHTRRDGP